MPTSINRRTALAALASIAAPAQTTAADLNRVAIGVAPPDFDLPSASGIRRSLASLKGSNVVLVFYRGYW